MMPIFLEILEVKIASWKVRRLLAWWSSNRFDQWDTNSYNFRPHQKPSKTVANWTCVL